MKRYVENAVDVVWVRRDYLTEFWFFWTRNVRYAFKTLIDR